MTASPAETVNAAIAALRRFDRRTAAALLKSLIDREARIGESWKNVARLADQIGEIETSIAAMQRYAASEPRTLEKFLSYLSELATRDRGAEVEAELGRLPKSVFDRTEITHLRATLATQRGDFAAAEELVRRTIAEAPLTGQNWLGLSMIKKFFASDPDIGAMRRLEPQYATTTPTSKAAFYYGLGKALHDAKDYDAAFDAYRRGADAKRKEERFEAAALEKFASRVIADYSIDAVARLSRSRCASDRPIFVTGLPRSGTTLVEQILTSHRAVKNGAELNLFRAALQPAGDFSLAAAERHDKTPAAPYASDPWGEIAVDYLAMLSARFGPDGRIVDKTLNHSRFMGLILHAMPRAKVVWLRRDPEDNAISVFRNYFASAIPWSWSLEDIGRYFRTDDLLHAHWTSVFGDRILTVPYEALVTAPQDWITRILGHLDLPTEPQVFEPHRQQERAVLTASVAQVRAPISPSQIGAAKKYDGHMAPFRQSYLGE